ncbi:MAG: siderophore-interacting protein [Candidatus Andeanibacterium colombiense]|uniref:Siderophore-interacting protein n=1 Tax=Candidatus Andeanibacterium colombiense TaxID=3121345 RepID=A0AAJ5XBS6_9SPHN|nr:MAG: siderophore-interacting protein [Sphingomonadaceae bacterium]
MLAAGSPERPVTEPGRLSKALMRLWMKPATIVANEQLADRFHLITMEGPALADVAWLPGQKVQIAMGSAFVTRTYTPIEWNSSAGRTCILGYAHGDGPGSAWVRSVAPGDKCDIFGPRASLDLSRLPDSLAIVGDETSMGLAYAATQQDPLRPVSACLEVEDVERVGRVLEQLGLRHVTLIARRSDDAHIAAMKEVLCDAAANRASFVLSGKAGTIQELRQSLRLLSIPATHLITKAYWAAGKTGLD